MRTKWILIILKSLIQVILDSMKEIENSGDVDADGIPLSEEYEKLRFTLESLRYIVSVVQLNSESNEK